MCLADIQYSKYTLFSAGSAVSVGVSVNNSVTDHGAGGVLEAGLCENPLKPALMPECCIQ